MTAVVYRARKTEEAIDKAIAADQGNGFRAALEKHIMEQTDAFSQVTVPFRAHLGASVIGGKCPRAIWYGFRWTKVPDFPGRVMRLFNRGHLEEARFIACLETIGCTVYQLDENKKQFKMSGHGGHYGGSLDAVVTGLPDWPNGPALAEFKTHSDKSFNNLVKDGVLKSKPEHVSQMQQYMGAYNLPVALYMAVNKNDDSLYCELIHFDAEHAARDYQLAGTIIASDSPPDRVSQSPGWMVCKWCDYKDVCHDSQVPAVNCRTCAHVTACEDGTWICENPARAVEGDALRLDMDAQVTGCDLYELNWTMNE